MCVQVIQTFLVYFIVYTVAFEDLIYVYGEGNKEMSEQGRVQYQMIKERGVLPKYGKCWKSAIDRINGGCRYLSEDTQSDIALHITNCFLEMSGHETYNCELDKKPNLRGICISSMSDRAFNVYTEFYTHTQNICWFLRGQIWHETIAENTLKVGKQLEVSAQNQEDLIKVQRESLELQEKMLSQGRFLEKIMEDIYVSTRAHQEILKLLTQSISSLQTWIVGEISWIDSIIFNIFALFLIFIFTSSSRTSSARLPLFFLLFLNLIFERLICSIYTKFQENLDTQNLYSNIYKFVWYSRYAFTFLGGCVLVYAVLSFRDVFEQNLAVLNRIQDQNKRILKWVENCRGSPSPGKSISSNVDFISENKDVKRSVDFFMNSANSSSRENNYTFGDAKIVSPLSTKFDRESSVDSKENNGYSSSFARKQLFKLQAKKTYNLRTRQGTPDSGYIH